MVSFSLTDCYTWKRQQSINLNKQGVERDHRVHRSEVRHRPQTILRRFREPAVREAVAVLPGLRARTILRPGCLVHQGVQRRAQVRRGAIPERDEESHQRPGERALQAGVAGWREAVRRGYCLPTMEHERRSHHPGKRVY